MSQKCLISVNYPAAELAPGIQVGPLLVCNWNELARATHTFSSPTDRCKQIRLAVEMVSLENLKAQIRA